MTPHISAHAPHEFFEHLPSPIWIGTEDGNCLFSNQALSRFLGHPPEALSGFDWLDLVHSADQEPLLHWLAQRTRSRPRFRAKIRLFSRGRLRLLKVDARIHGDGDSLPRKLVITLSDAPARSTPTRLQTLHLEKLRLCFDYAPIGIGFLDLNLRFLHANPALASLLIGSVHALEGRSLGSILEPRLPTDSASEIERICAQTLRSGRPHALHGWPLSSPDFPGFPKLIDWEIRRVETSNNVPIGLLVTLSDVTQQKLVEERMRLLASVLESTPDFVAVLTPTGNVLYLNRSAREARRLAPEASIRALHYSDLQPEWAAHLVRDEGFPAALDEGSWEAETAFIQADGITVPVSQILCAHRNAAGQVEFLSTILRDITDALVIREQLDSTQDSLKQRVAERTAELAEATALIRDQIRQEAEAASLAKSAFLSRMSHELRTPLNAILGFAQLLKLEDPSPSQLESIGHISRAGRHLLSLINEVLDISQIESGRLALTMEPLEMNGFLGNCVELMRPIAAASSVDIQFIPRASPVHIRADRQRLKQVVLNFLSNAIKYNNEGGMVLVSLRLTLSSARFEIRDTGPGIPLEKRTRLFLPFERLGAESGEIEGSGIGLALCKGLLDAMSGKIGLENPDGGGCAFWAELPLADPSELPQLRIERLPAALAPQGPLPQLRAAKILIVEAHDFDLQLMERLLLKQPHLELLSAMQGDLGLELAREHHPDLILLDIDLPDLSAAEFLGRIRTADPGKKIHIVLLGTESHDSRLTLLSERFNTQVLVKPYAPEDLMTLLRSTIPA